MPSVRAGDYTLMWPALGVADLPSARNRWLFVSYLRAERPNAKEKIAQLDAEFRWRNDL
jgi:hypothetical protein